MDKENKGKQPYTPTGWENSKLPRKSAAYIFNTLKITWEDVYGRENCSPARNREILRQGIITKEEAQQREQYWLEQYKTWSTEELDDSLRDLQEDRAYKMECADKACAPGLSDDFKEAAQDYKYEIELTQ